MCTAYAEEWTWEILLIAIVGSALVALILISLIYLFVCCCRGNTADVSDGSIILQFRKNRTQTGEGNQSQAYENAAYSDIVPTGNNAQTGQGVALENQEHEYSDVGPPRNDTQTVCLRCGVTSAAFLCPAIAVKYEMFLSQHLPLSGVASGNQDQQYAEVGSPIIDAQTGQGAASGNQEHEYSDVGPFRNNAQTDQGVTSGAAIYGNAAISENRRKQRNEAPQSNGQTDTGK